jgi:transketolase
MSWSLIHEHQSQEMRAVYADTLKKLLENDENVVLLDSDLANSAGTGKLFSEYKDRCIDFGICEQNMIGGGAGLSMAGLVPYAHTFAPFASRRVLDQVFMSLAYANNSLHIYASDPGYWAQYNGGTHTTFEDVAAMRAIPNINVVAPSDPVTFRWILNYYHTHKGIYYDRAPRSSVDCIYDDNSNFEYGKGQLIRHGIDVVIIAIGEMVNTSLKAAELLERQGISTSVVDLLFIKPYDQALIRKVISEHPLVITAENHNKYGGIGDLVAAEMAAIGRINSVLRKIAVDDRFGEVGNAEYLSKTYHLTEEDIAGAAVEFFSKKLSNI